MPRFSSTSTRRLETVDPDLSRLFAEVVKRRDCTILCGVRSKTEQDLAVSSGRSKMTWPNSKHNVLNPDDLARAVDVAPYFANQNHSIVWPTAAKTKIVYAKECGLYYNFAGYVQAVADRMGIRVRWGGDWNGNHRYTDQSFDDLIHWELVGDGDR